MTDNNHIEFKTVTNIYTGELTDSYIVNAKEIEIIKREVTKDDYVMDIGANVGFMTTVLAGLAKHVYAFEPEPNNYDKLMQNTKNLKNVWSFDVAISDELGMKTFYLCPQDPGMNRLYNSKWCKGGEQIEVIGGTIDHFVYTFIPKDKISFIKMDIEGYEYHAIRGAIKLLKRDHPTILMEFHPPSIEEAGDNPEDIYNLLKHELGYDDPFNCSTDYRILSYEDLDRQTRDTPAINILWKYNNAM